MPVAAVPKYLGRDFKTASPGLRFSIYLPVWTERADQERQVKERAQKKSKEGGEIQEILAAGGMDQAIRRLQDRKKNPIPRLWEKDVSGARGAWATVCALKDSDTLRLKALADRSRALYRFLNPAAVLRLEALSVSPFTTGLGNEHPLENGFSFLNPYGLPYLPGSGVKGVIRRAAEELSSGEWGNSSEWSDSTEYRVPVDDENKGEAEDEPDARKALSLMDLLFGKESESGDKEHFRGVLTFWDVVPIIAGGRLLVEIMTPHFSHYYQGKPAEGSQSPHDSGQPNPISFLTVPPGSEFTFHVTCDLRRLERIAPPLAHGDKWKQLLETAFEHAFEWLGFGAKTAVGYGSMRKVASAPQGAHGAAGSQRGVPEPAAITPSVQKQAVSELVWPKALLKFNPGQQQITAEFEKKSALLAKERNQAFLEQLGAERAEVLKKRKSLLGVPVRVEQEGNKYTLLGVAESD